MKIFNRKKTEEKSAKPKIAKTAKPANAAKTSMKDLYAGEAGARAVKSGAKTEVRAHTAGKGNAYRVLVRPLITEKASHMGAINKYFFAVADKANKIEVAKAVNEAYGIMPEAVNIIVMQGKKTRSGRIIGKRKDWKKAIVTLPKGKSINLYEGV